MYEYTIYINIYSVKPLVASATRQRNGYRECAFHCESVNFYWLSWIYDSFYIPTENSHASDIKFNFKSKKERKIKRNVDHENVLWDKLYQTSIDNNIFYLSN